MSNNGMLECNVCHSKLQSPTSRTISKAYDRHKSNVSSKHRAINILLVTGDCVLVGLQAGQQKAGEKPLLSVSTFVQAAHNNVILAVPAFLYAINNYLKFIMQLYFNPATVKMLSNLKVLVIALLLKIVMQRCFSVIQWEALALLLIGISVNQLRSMPEGTTALGLPFASGAYLYTLIFNLFLYGYGAIFNFLGIIVMVIIKGHSRATTFLICNNAAQGILSSFFFKYADTILKKYSSTVATIFTGIASAVLFGHTLTINFILGISIVFISMHQFFSPLAKVKDDPSNGTLEMSNSQSYRENDKETSFINMTAGANEEASHRFQHEEQKPLLPIRC